MVEMRDSVLPRFREVAQYWRTVLRSGVIGVLTGLMPGVGEDAGAWMSYAAAKAVSKERDQFGKGSIDGLMAAETGDMSSIPGHIIPALALGIPGSAPSAVLMAAMIIHGIQPGPMLMIEHPQFIYDVVAMTSLAGMAFLANGSTPSRGAYSENVAKIVEYLISNVRSNGLITGPTTVFASVGSP